MLFIIFFQIIFLSQIIIILVLFFVIYVRFFDSFPLPDFLSSNIVNFFLVLSALRGVLNLHETGGHHGLHLLDLLNAKLTPDLLELLVNSFQLIILRLQFFLLLYIFLHHLLIELLVLLF